MKLSERSDKRHPKSRVQCLILLLRRSFSLLHFLFQIRSSLLSPIQAQRRDASSITYLHISAEECLISISPPHAPKETYIFIHFISLHA